MASNVATFYSRTHCHHLFDVKIKKKIKMMLKGSHSAKNSYFYHPILSIMAFNEKGFDTKKITNDDFFFSYEKTRWFVEKVKAGPEKCPKFIESRSGVKVNGRDADWCHTKLIRTCYGCSFCSSRWHRFIEHV